jgi:hypothetical protein
MENHIQLTSGLSANNYLRQFQIARLNFYLFIQEEKRSKQRARTRYRALDPVDINYLPLSK